MTANESLITESRKAKREFIDKVVFGLTLNEAEEKFLAFLVDMEDVETVLKVLQHHPESKGVSTVKIWKVSVASVMLLTVTVSAILVKNEWEQKVERLQLLNRVTNEELQMVRQVVKEQNAELQEKNKEIAKLKSQPK